MKQQDIHIRITGNSDLNDIIKIETLAFGHDKEAKLTYELLNDKTARPYLSLIAFHNENAIGHILFTRAYLNNMSVQQPLIHILAPLAVIPGYQKKGIGELLIKEGLEKLREEGSEMVFVLGHMDYYPRHGFIPDAKRAGYRAPYPIPDEFVNAWMVQPLTSGGFTIPGGKVICADKLMKPEHWRE